MPDESGSHPSDLEEPSDDAVCAGEGELDAARTVPAKRFPSSHWQPPTVEEVAALFPSLEVQAQIGRGGMGAVYRARHPVLNRLIAIKLLPLEISADPSFSERFIREAQVMAMFTHPNIVAVYDSGRTSEGHLFFTMEYVDGSDLHKLIHGSGVAPEQALEMVSAVCSALSYAHAGGVVHRDIKPANIMVDLLGQVKVTDFGLARRSVPGIDDSGYTVTGMIMGTPDYMAPEQMRAMNVDPRADIYALGVVLYETLCRDLPKGNFEWPSIRVGTDPGVDLVIGKAMQPQIDRRYQTATEMKIDLDEILVRGRGPGTGELSRPSSPGKNAGLAKQGWMIFVALIVFGSVVFFFREYFFQERSPEPVTPQLSTPVPTPIVTPAPIPTLTPAPTPKITPTPTVTVLPVKPPGPTPVPPSPISPTGRWILENGAKWQADFHREVIEPFDKEWSALKQQYLEELLSQEGNAGKNNSSDVGRKVQEEKKRLAQGIPLPLKDDPSLPHVLLLLRENHRKEIAKIDNNRATRAGNLLTRYDETFGKLIRAQNLKLNFEEAQELIDKLKELHTLWLQPSDLVVRPVAAVQAATPAPPSVTPGPTPLPAVGSLAVTPAPSSVPTLRGHALVVKLLELGAVVKSREEIKKVSDIPDGKFTLKTVDFGRRGKHGEWTEAEYAIIDQLVDAQEVILREGTATDETLARLVHCQAASTIQLIDLPKVTGEGLKVLRKLRNLKRLCLTRLKLDTAGLQDAIEDVKADQLELSDLMIGDDGMKIVAAMKYLEKLRLKGLRQMTVAGLASLAAASKLHKLEVADQPFGPQAIEAVAAIKELESLGVENSTLAGADLLPLASLPQLKSLELPKSTLTGPLFVGWPEGLKLETLILPKDRNLDAATTENIAKCFPKLTRLSGAAGDLEPALEYLARLKGLTKLQLTSPVSEALKEKLRQMLPRVEIEFEK